MDKEFKERLIIVAVFLLLWILPAVIHWAFLLFTWIPAVFITAYLFGKINRKTFEDFGD